jgi:hypothetical protein
MGKCNKECVEYLLNYYPSTRSSDKELVYRYWYEFIYDKEEHYYETFVGLINNFINNTPYESITRCRRNFQRHGMYLAEHQVKKYRDRLENEMRKELSPNE